MASVITAVSSGPALLSLGGYRDQKGIAAALAVSAGLTFETISGGGTVAAGKAAVVLDGQGVTLAAAPADQSRVVVISASEAAPVTVTAGAGDTINGIANTVVHRVAPLLYTSGTKDWTNM